MGLPEHCELQISRCVCGAVSLVVEEGNCRLYLWVDNSSREKTPFWELNEGGSCSPQFPINPQTPPLTISSVSDSFQLFLFWIGSVSDSRPLFGQTKQWQSITWWWASPSNLYQTHLDGPGSASRFFKPQCALTVNLHPVNHTTGMLSGICWAVALTPPKLPLAFHRGEIFRLQLWSLWVSSVMY